MICELDICICYLISEIYLPSWVTYNEHDEAVGEYEHGVLEQLRAAAVRGLGRQQPQRVGGALQLRQVGARRRAAARAARPRASAFPCITFLII